MRDRGTTWTWLRTLVATAIVATGVVVVAPVGPASAELAATPASATNKDLLNACGLKVTLILDESLSISSAQAVNVKNAVVATVNGLQNTGSSLRIVEFSKVARDASLGGVTGFQNVDATLLNRVNAYFNNNSGASNSGYNTQYNNSGQDGTGGTNWERAFQVANAGVGPGDLVIFLTDGVPTAYGTGPTIPNPISSNEFTSTNRTSWTAALDDIAAVQAKAHVIGIGVGSAGATQGGNENTEDQNFGSIARLIERSQNASGNAVTVDLYDANNGAANPTTHDYNGGGDETVNYNKQGTLDLRTVDAINAGSFETLQTELAKIASSSCVGSVQLTKTVNGLPGGITPQNFQFTITHHPSGGVAQQNFTPQTLTFPGTNPNSVAWDNLTPGQSYTIAETAPPTGFSAGALTCTGVGVSDTDGSATNASFKFVMPANQPGIEVTCAITNTWNPQTKIIIEKDAQPNSDQDFAFTGNPSIGAFSLDDDGDATLPNSREFVVAPGTYTVAETANANDHFYLHSRTCQVTTDLPPLNDSTASLSGNDGLQINVKLGDQVTCTFVNRGQAYLQLTKTWVPGGDSGATAQLTATSSLGGSINQTSTSPTFTTTTKIAIPLGSATPFAEVVAPAANYVSAAACSGGGTLSNPTQYGGNIVTTDADLGKTITCNFTNTRRGTIIVDKVSVGGDGTFTYTNAHGIDLNPSGADSITTASGQGPELTASVAPGSYTITEAQTPGFRATSIVCQDGTGSTVASTVNLASRAATFNVEPGETVKCTWTNTINTVKVVVAKQIVPESDPGRFDLSINGQLKVDNGGDNSSSAASPVIVTVGTNFNVSEAAGEPSPGLANYGSTLVCPGATQVSNTGTAGTFTVPIDAAHDSTITCTFTNTRTPSGGVLIQKIWVNGTAPHTATLSASLNDTPFGSSVISSAPAAPVEGTNTIFVPASAGDRVTFAETLSAAANYTASWECKRGNGTGVSVSMSTVGQNDLDGFVTVPPNIGANERIVCSITNTRLTTPIRLVKEWVGPTDATATVGLVLGGDVVTPVNGASSHDGVANETAATATGLVGGTVTLAETGLPARYTRTGLSCWAESDGNNVKDSGEVAVTVNNDSVTVPDLADGVALVCKFVNTRNQTTLTLSKVWINAAANDSVTLRIDTTANGSIEHSGVAVATAGNSTITPAGTTNKIVYAGDTVRLSEVFGANAGTYQVTGFTCTNATIVGSHGGVADLDLEITVPDAAGAAIACSVTNTRTSQSLTVQKTWQDPVGGTTVTLATSGGLGTLIGSELTPTSPANLVVDADLQTPAPPTQVVYSGEQVTVRETFASADVASYFATTLTCNGVTIPNTLTGAERGGVVKVNDFTGPITCTFDNVRKSATLELAKDWVNPAAGDSYTLTLAKNGGTPPVTATAIAPAASGPSTSGVASIVLYAGPTNVVALSEAPTVDAANVGTYDVADLTCSAGIEENFNTGGIQHSAATSVTVDASDVLAANAANTALRCTFTNTRLGSIVVDKIGSPVDASQPFDFTVAGQAVNGLTIPGPASAPVWVLPGTYQIKETKVAGWVLTNIECNTAGGNYSLAAGTADVAVAAGQAVSCSFTNNQDGDVQLSKTGAAAAIPHAEIPGRYTISYTVTANNTAFIPKTETVTDVFGFPSTIAVVDGTLAVTGSPYNADWDGTAANPVLFDGAIPGQTQYQWVITLDVLVDLGAGHNDRTCDVAANGGRGAWNGATLNDEWEDGDPEWCISFPTPSISIVKRHNDPVTVGADGTMTATYLIDVKNTGTGPGEYTLTDHFEFPSWVTVTDVAVAGGTGTSPIADPAHTAAADQTVTLSTDGVAIAGTSTHTYTVTITFTGAPTATSAGADCSVDGAGNGLFNTAAVSATGGTKTDPDCLDIPRGRLVITKATVGGTGEFGFLTSPAVTLFDGSAAEAAAITTTATNGTASGGTLSAWVTPGSYTVAESSPAIAAPNNWVATALPCQPGQAAQVVDGGTARCDFVNAKRGPLNLTKSVNGAATYDAAQQHYTVGYDLVLTTTSAVPEAFTLSDTLQFGVGTTVTGVAITEVPEPSDAPAPLATWNGGIAGLAGTSPQADTTLAVGAIAPGQTFTYHVVVTFTVDATLTPTSADCTLGSDETGTGTRNSASASFNDGTSDPNPVCSPIPNVTVTKVAKANQPAHVAGNEYTITYDVNVTNTGGAATPYTAVDEPGFAPGATITKVVVDGAEVLGYDAGESIDLVAKTVLVGGGQQAPSLSAGATKTYTVVITFTVDPAMPAVDRTCVPATGQPGQATFNSVTVAWNGPRLEAHDCENIPTPDIEITKSAVGEPELVGGSTYTQQYTISVTNNGDGPGTYSVSDTPQYGLGATPTGATVNTVPVASFGVPFTVATDQHIAPEATHNYTVVVTFAVDADMTETARECGQAGVPGSGTFNAATVTPNIGTPDTDDACTDIPAPEIKIAKTAVGAPQPAGANTYTQQYTITVTNEGDGPGTYSVTDTPQFGTGATPIGATVDTVPVGSFGVPFTVATDVSIEPGNEHEYTVVVTFTVAADMTQAERECGVDAAGPDSGTFNAATVTPNIGPSDTDDDCTNIPGPTVSVEKTAPASVEHLSGYDYEATYTVTVTNGGPGLAVYTLTDTPDFGTGVTITDVRYDNASLGTTFPVTVAADVSLPAGEQDTYQVTVRFTIPATTTSAARLCGEAPNAAGTGGFNSATVTFSGGDDTSSDCVNLPNPDISVTKTIVSDPAQPELVDAATNTYTVAYDLVVDNSGQGPGVYTLTDELGFGTGATITEVQIGDTVLNPLALEFIVAADVPIEADGSDTYRVVVTFTVDPTMTPGERECATQGTGSGSGAFNAATVDPNIGPDDSDDACVDVPAPNITVTKVARDDQPVYDDSTNTYKVTYDIVVRNTGTGPGTYNLADAPNVATGASVEGYTITPQPTADRAIGAGQSHPYVAVVTLTVPGSVTARDAECGADAEWNGGGTYNSATVTPNIGAPVSDDDCVDLPNPDIDVVKTVRANQPEQVSGTTFRVTYDIAVTNNGDGPGTYTLTDLPDITSGATIVDTVVTPDPADNTEILAGDTHDYVVVVTFTVSSTATNVDAECAAEWNGGGTYNSVTVDPNIGDTVSDDACANLPELGEVTIVKRVTEMTGNGAWEFGFDISPAATLVSPDATIGGAGESTAADTVAWSNLVPGVEYTITEVLPSDAGWSGGQIVCSVDGGEPVSMSGAATLAIAPGDAVECTFDNLQHPADLVIDKSHSGIPDNGDSVQAGDVFDWVITVDNVGQGPALDVVVTDTLPARVEIAGTPTVTPVGATPVVNGNTVTVNLGTVNPADPVIAITIPVRVLPPTAGPDDALSNTACVEAVELALECDGNNVTLDEIVATVEVVCRNDAAFLAYEVSTSDSLAGQPITLVWAPTTPGATPAQVTADNVAPDTRHEIAWPGVGFTPSGISVDWPGWRPIVESDYENGVLKETDASKIRNGMILDAAQPDFAWRNGTTATFSAGPATTVDAAYPTVLPDSCVADRGTALSIDKSVNGPTTYTAGDQVTYDIAVVNTSAEGAATSVVLTDVIPATERVDSITTSATAFPRWTNCEVVGEDAAGYGGTLTCTLFGPLAPNAAAPLVSLKVTINPAAQVSSITNIAAVEWALFDDPNDTGEASDAVEIAVVAQAQQPPPPPPPPAPAPLPATGSSLVGKVLPLGLTLIGLGLVATLASRRRRHASQAG